MMPTFPFASSPQLQHWILVDTLRVPNAMQKAYEHEALPELRKLFQNSQFEYLLDQSPVLFNISANSSLLPILTTSFAWRSSAVIFSVPNSTSIELLTEHLINLMTVNMLDKPMLFRCYNNAVWMQVANKLNAADINSLLGPAVGLSWVNEQGAIESLFRSPAMAELAATPYRLQSDIWHKWM
ncbi:DUF4123 domain-containing protein [Shewanella sp. VB17]|uniref:DUF4123 domain-containing protein n=1 Tax=Shewanella sp. VB17 TaxID=2739432 RepID=UPI001563FB8F|nr:DUF4123 domain-containing protein [Shewanella sp. VB17]NRD72202.1 DUF4123 domain-containing protein [Shewanella sp. VB17]